MTQFEPFTLEPTTSRETKLFDSITVNVVYLENDIYFSVFAKL